MSGMFRILITPGYSPMVGGESEGVRVNVDNPIMRRGEIRVNSRS